MIAGSGMREKPSVAIEESMEGLSLKVKSTPSRAPPACSSADTMARAVCEKLALGRYFRAEIGQSFHGSQQPPQIVFLHSHASMRAKTRAKKE